MGLRNGSYSERWVITWLLPCCSVLLSPNDTIEARVDGMYVGDRLYQDVIHALPEQMAVLDSRGFIIATNHAWEEFAAENGAADTSTVSVGANYLEVCRRALAGGDQYAVDALEGIEAVLSDRVPLFRMEYPCHSPHKQRWFLMTATRLRGATNGAVVTHSNVSRRRLAELELRESELRLNRAIEAATSGTWSVNLATGELVTSERALILLGLQPGTAIDHDRLFACIHPDDRKKAAAVIADAASSGQRLVCEFRAPQPDASIRWLACYMERHIRDNEPVLVGLMQDISEQKAREHQSELVAKEVDHRLKNLLSLVQVVAQRTFKTAPQDFPTLFAERLHSLARTQDLLVAHKSPAISIFDLIGSQLDGISDVMGHRIKIEGPLVLLKSRAAQAIGMALHELVTNAVKYGSLSNDVGEVSLRWSIEPQEGEEEQFTLTWRESAGPTVAPPSRRGFGSTVISDLIRMTLKGDVTLRYGAMGFSWRVSCAASEVAEQDRSTYDVGAGNEP